MESKSFPFVADGALADVPGGKGGFPSFPGDSQAYQSTHKLVAGVGQPPPAAWVSPTFDAVALCGCRRGAPQGKAAVGSSDVRLRTAAIPAMAVAARKRGASEALDRRTRLLGRVLLQPCEGGTGRAGGCQLRISDATSTFWGRCPEKSRVPGTELGTCPGLGCGHRWPALIAVGCRHGRR